MKNNSATKSLAKRKYAKDANAEHYFKILDEALNFPFNLESENVEAEYKNFYDWEIKKGYRKPIIEVETIVEESMSIPNQDSLSDKVSETIKDLMSSLKEKEEYLSEFSKGYKPSFKKKYNLYEDDWLNELPKIKREIDALRHTIRDIKAS